MSPRIHTEDVRPGDILWFFGTPHLIAEVVPGQEPTRRIVGPDAAYARDADGWSITIGGGQSFEVDRA